MRYGKGDWVMALEDPSVYLNRKLIEERKLDAASVETAAGEAVLTLPGFQGYATRTQLLHGQLPPVAASSHRAQLLSAAFRGRCTGAGTLFLLGQVWRVGFRIGPRQLQSL